eukprot:366260-Chlamydomonas_euryale.AAC.11
MLAAKFPTDDALAPRHPSNRSRYLEMLPRHRHTGTSAYGHTACGPVRSRTSIKPLRPGIYARLFPSGLITNSCLH